MAQKKFNHFQFECYNFENTEKLCSRSLWCALHSPLGTAALLQRYST